MVTEPAQDPLLGKTLLGRYQVCKLLGKGGMGGVYLVEHQAMGTKHALKIMHGSIASAAGTQERFLREAKLCARIRHPNMVLVTDFGIHDGDPALVMDYVEGKDLSQLIAGGKVIPEKQALAMISSIASALAVIHEHGIIHRDLKPANIMLEKGTGRTVLMDLGIAKDLADEGLTMGVVGTPAYMSPEQARDSATVGITSDIYSLGATLLAILMGKPPIKGTSALQVLVQVRERVFAHGSILGLVENVKDRVSPAVVELIRDMTRYEPRDRIPDMKTLLQRIEATLDQAEGHREDTDYATMVADSIRSSNTILEESLVGIDEDSGLDAMAERFTQPTASHGTAPLRQGQRGPIVIAASLLLLLVLAGGLVWVWSIGDTSVEVEPVDESSPQGAMTEVLPPTMADSASEPAPVSVAAGTQDQQQTTPTVLPDQIAIPLDGTPLSLRRVPAGQIRLGSENSRRSAEMPRVTVTFSGDFYMGETEVTRECYAAFLNATGAAQHDPGQNQFEQIGGIYRVRGDGRLPVAAVSLLDARAFCRWASEQSGLVIRLPAEAEWEYAARGPAAPTWPWGDRWRPDLAAADGRSGPSPVGSYPEGASWSGLLDMAGNLFEWCDDWYDEERWHTLSPNDPRPDPSTNPQVFHAVRGGSYANPRELCRSAFRIGIRADDRQAAVGFRVLVEVNEAFLAVVNKE